MRTKAFFYLNNRKLINNKLTFFLDQRTLKVKGKADVNETSQLAERGAHPHLKLSLKKSGI